MTALRSVSMIIAAVYAFATFSLVTFGQEKQVQLSGLAGDWQLVIPRGERFYRSGALSVRVKGDEVEILREFEDSDGVTERKLTYFADGRGELNFWVLSDGKTEIDRQSKSKWKKNKLVIIWSYKSNGSRFEVEEIYKLSSNGEQLTYTMNNLAPRVPFQSSFGSMQELTFLRKK